jgi:hypothetical protein
MPFSVYKERSLRVRAIFSVTQVRFTNLDKLGVKLLSILILLLFMSACAVHKRAHQRLPSSELASGPCSQGIQLFFEESTKKELGQFSEEALFEMGVLRPSDLESIRQDVVFKDLILSEDEHLREETVKVIALIRKHRPDLAPAKVSDFYHELFQSCKL